MGTCTIAGFFIDDDYWSSAGSRFGTYGVGAFLTFNLYTPGVIVFTSGYGSRLGVDVGSGLDVIMGTSLGGWTGVGVVSS